MTQSTWSHMRGLQTTDVLSAFHYCLRLNGVESIFPTWSMILLGHNMIHYIAWRFSYFETDVEGEPCFTKTPFSRQNMDASHDKVLSSLCWKTFFHWLHVFVKHSLIGYLFLFWFWQQAYFWAKQTGPFRYWWRVWERN